MGSVMARYVRPRLGAASRREVMAGCWSRRIAPSRRVVRRSWLRQLRSPATYGWHASPNDAHWSSSFAHTLTPKRAGNTRSYLQAGGTLTRAGADATE